MLQRNAGKIHISAENFASFIEDVRRVEIRSDKSIAFVQKNGRYTISEGGMQHLFESPEGHSRYTIPAIGVSDNATEQQV